MSNKQYLGDGVYIETETEAGMLRMTANNINQDNIIFLESEVMNALIQYYKDLLGVEAL